MQNDNRAYVELHFAVFLFGFTAIIGDIVRLSALHIVWWRLALTVVTLLFIVNYIKLFRTVDRKRLFQYLGIGILVALHWLAFYGSVKLSNASIALICLATTSFFTSFIEPMVMHRAFHWYEILLGMFIIPGMVLVVNGTNPDMYLGIIVGLIAALMASLFSTLNKKYIEGYKAMQITAIELLSALVFLTFLLPIFIPDEGIGAMIPEGIDWLWLSIMAVLCTTVAYSLSLRALRYLSAFASSLTFNLEPLYGAILAYFFLNDAQELNFSFYIGGVIILLVVFSHPIINNYFKKKRMERVER